MCPDGIDCEYLREFKKFIYRRARGGTRFVIVAGGGKVSRRYQEAAAKIDLINNEDKDWMGIHATRLNAHLLRTIFRRIADPVVIDMRHKIKKISHKITIVSGWHPGWSTDYVGVACAVDFGAREVVIAGKPSHVYTKDHAIHADAMPFKNLTWKEYRKIIPAIWVPGSHTPVDPVASRLAQKKSISAIIINGKDLKNFDALLKGKEFEGTIIQ